MRHVERLHDIATKVRVELVRREWSEPKLASEVGMSARTLNDRLNGYSDWKLHEILDLAGVLFENDLTRLLEPGEAEKVKNSLPAQSASLVELAQQLKAAAEALVPGAGKHRAHA